MPTIRGFRRKGYTPEAINNFCDRIGITRNENVINVNLLEQCCREDLDVKANRAMAVLEPLRVTITNWEGGVKEISVPNHPKDASRGTHTVPLSGVLYIERSDFREEDIKGYKRLAPKKSVGLMHASAVITCTDYVKDANGNVTELKATIDLSLKSKPAGFIHWVAEPAPGKEPLAVEVRLYDFLFKSDEPAAIDDWVADLNPNSLVVVPKAYVDPSVKTAKTGTQFQFERTGYFAVDPDTTSEKMVWNRVVSLKESKDKEF
jgi:glutaminyl-tRNA synthetase